MNKWLILAVVLAASLGLALMAGGGFLAFRFLKEVTARDRLPPREEEDFEAKRAEVADAFRNEPVGGEAEEARAIKTLLETLGQALAKGDEDGIAACFDAERMFQEIARLVPGRRPSRNEDRAFAAGFKAGMVQSLKQNAAAFHWERVAVKRVKFLGASGEAVVFTRLWDGHGDISERLRWWVRKHDGRWRVYDFEDLATSIRVSTVAGLTIQAGLAQAPVLAEAGRKLAEGSQALLVGNLDEAEKAIEAAAAPNVPAPIEAVRLLLMGTVKLGRGLPREALTFYERAEALQGDLPALAYLRAIAYNQLGQFDKALAHGRQFIEQLGDDANAYHEIGTALLGLNRPGEAEVAFRKGLDDNPGAVENLAGLRQALPADRKAEVGVRFAKLPKPQEHFEELAEEALGDGDGDGLIVLADALGKLVPGDAMIPYYNARAKILKGQPLEAVPLFKAALAKEEDEGKRRDYVDGFLQAMLEAQKPLDAYQAAPDPEHAFDVLAGGLYGSKNLETLRRLIDAHRKQKPNDVWLFFYEGQAHQIAGDFDKAETAYAAGMAKPLDEQGRQRFRYARVYALFQAGKGLLAYEKIGPKKETFSQLTWLFADAKDAKQLEALVAAHRKAEPTAKDLPRWEMEVFWLKGEYDRAVKVLRDQREGLLADPNNRWIFQDRLVRCLVRLKRPGEALKELEALPEEEPLLLTALAHAAAGDLLRTEQALAEFVKDPEDAAEIYSDPDLGPILRTEPFKALREKYPEPPKP